MAMIKDRIRVVRDNIARVCHRIGRDPDEITLLGVTKYSPVEDVREAMSCGIRDLGEIRVQDAREKFAALGEQAAGVRKHLIGHLQTNKVKLAVRTFDMIQTLDSERLADEIEKHAAAAQKVMDVLVEVNCSQEAQKSGVAAEGLLPLLKKVSALPHLRVQGLMTMAALSDDESVVRKAFRELRTLSETAAREFPGAENIRMDCLSMGMTHDYEIALEEGATMLRIGSAIFLEK